MIISRADICMNHVCSAVDTIIKQGSLSESQRMRITRQYTSRVHVADICQALKASIQMPSLGYVPIFRTAKLHTFFWLTGKSHWNSLVENERKKIQKDYLSCLPMEGLGFS